MKRQEMVEKIKEFLKGYEDSGFEEELEDDASALLSMVEHFGMLPPSIRISTPLGPRIFFDTNEWEENAKYDDEGCPTKEWKK